MESDKSLIGIKLLCHAEKIITGSKPSPIYQKLSLDRLDRPYISNTISPKPIPIYMKKLHIKVLFPTN